MTPRRFCQLVELRKPEDRIKPWMYTFPEYVQIVNSDGKVTPAHAYNHDVASLRSIGYLKRERFGKRLRTIDGIDYLIKTEPLTYCKLTDPSDPSSDWQRDASGNLAYMSPDEMAAAGCRDREHLIGAFDGDAPVGSAQNEWGCTLIQVAREYRGRGIGTELCHLWRSIYGGMKSGGLSQAGYANLFRVHRRFVQDAVRYDRFNKAGMSPDRIADIIKSTEHPGAFQQS